MAQVTVLLVDDDPLLRSLGKELLEHLGYRVEVAGDGPEAMQVFRRAAAVDLVILDFYLPGQDGYQVLQALKSLDPGVRVLLASGFFSSQDEARLKAGGARDLINKPYRLGELKERIQKVLAGQEGG